LTIPISCLDIAALYRPAPLLSTGADDIADKDRSFLTDSVASLKSAGTGSPDSALLFQRDDDISEIRRIQAACHKTAMNAEMKSR
jgi:hypothetical protein